jgi:fermentation-respiration switch protein FrsA (DUF1100 family)
MSGDELIKIGDSSALSWLLFLGKVTLGISSVICLALYNFQDKILYMPNPPGFPETPDKNPPFYCQPSEWSIKGKPIRNKGEIPLNYEEEMLTTTDGIKINTWLILQPNSNEVPTLIYFHGNAGNMGFRLKNAAEMFFKLDINILMMDYRGFGRSTGIPSEKGLNIDADTVLKYALNHAKLKKSPLISFGRSLGGAVAVSLAHRYPQSISGVVLENTFLSISSMVDKLLPYVSLLKPLVLRIKWDSDVKIKELNQPIMFISGDADTLVPPVHMKKLHDTATHSKYKDFFSVIGGGHNDSYEDPSYYSRMKDFINISFGNLCDNNIVNSKIDDEDDDYEKIDSFIPTMGNNFNVK